jgi:phage baseplate assembly protein W
MPYQIVPSTINTSTISSLGLSYSGNVIFAPVYISTVQATNQLKDLLLTKIGERYNQPTYGTNLLYVLFEPNLNEIKDDIRSFITGPVSFWLPSITIDSIDIVTSEDDPNILYDVQIKINYRLATTRPPGGLSLTIGATQQGNVVVAGGN